MTYFLPRCNLDFDLDFDLRFVLDFDFDLDLDFRFVCRLPPNFGAPGVTVRVVPIK